MRSEDKRDRIHRSVIEAYGTLTSPNFGFQERKLKRVRSDPVVISLMQRWFVQDLTDLNDHAAMHLCVQHDFGRCVVCLSLVAKWAAAFRLDNESNSYRKVLRPCDPELLGPERDIATCLEHHKWIMLDKRDLVMALPMNLYNTEPLETCVYHSLISDDGFVPNVLTRAGD
ncbi:MAG: hypothetical protein AAF297_03345 [Planctomycetota bacterium]